MDPNANLEEQRQLAKRILDGTTPDFDRIEVATRLAELVDALDQWLSIGGALPISWSSR